jgi:hypothetical protein
MAEIRSQEQFEKVRAALKAGKWSDQPELEREILEAAKAWKESQFGATSGMSGVDKFRAGMGKGFADLMLAAQQRAADIGSILPMNPAAGAAANITKQRLQREAQNRRERDAPLMDTGAGFAGNLTGNIAAFAPMGGAITSIPRAMALGAAEGAMVPTASDEELGQNVGFGGALGAGGQVAARSVARAFRPVQNSLSNAKQEAVDLLRREGVDLDVAQRTGSESAQRLRSGLNDNPLTATRSANFTENQRRQFTRAVLRRIGADSDEATPDVLRRAVTKIGDDIDQALNTRPPVWDDALDAQMREIQQMIPGSMSAQDAAPLLRNIDDLMNSALADGDMVIQPAVFTRIRANLSNLRAKGNPLAGEVEDIMLDALQRSGGNPAGLQTALARYRNWKIIENSIDKGTDRYISPARLSNTFGQKRNRAASLRHLGHQETVELSRLADAGRAVLPETIGNSGTTARGLANDLMLAIGGAGGAAASGANIGGAAVAGAGALTLPMLLQRGMLSQGVLGNYLAQGASPALQGLTNSPVTQSLIRQGVISQGLLGQ